MASLIRVDVLIIALLFESARFVALLGCYCSKVILCFQEVRRYCSASEMCAVVMSALDSKSAIVRATLMILK